MNRCEETFQDWLSDAYSKLPEGEDFPVDDEFMYEIWQRCWRRAYSIGLSHGQDQTVTRFRMMEERKVTPMPNDVMLQLFKRCQTGREFGKEVEKWHGIRENA
jgi:hypothetical protein